jgi:charged multivesicular body protein 1
MTAKMLNRQATKAHKESEVQKAKVKKVCLIIVRVLIQAIQQGNSDIARIHAGNSIRKEQERLNLLRLSSRIDAVASRVRTAVTMRNVVPSYEVITCRSQQTWHRSFEAWIELWSQ